MRRYFAPRQHMVTGKWHFTVQEGDMVRPVGPCADDCPGHDTGDDAILHYAGHLIDERKTVIRDGNFVTCLICGGKTNRRVRIGNKELHLCQDHMDTKTLLRFVDLGTLMREEHGAPEEKASGLIITP